MALATFMRSACRSSRVSPGLSVAAKFSPVSSIAFNKTSQPSNSSLLATNSLIKHNVIREISTTPVRMSGDHAKLWTIERGVSAILIPATPLALLYPSIATDLFMSVSLVMHVHWGIEAIAVDYVRPIIFGNTIPKVALGLVYVMSIATLVGLLNLIFNGPGLANSVREIWKL